ncbi:hypothetical protein [Micrococcus sp. FDAARGOS_333]|uniref:hypothetical protein n=1 Tax=Micrococcus sp. FDAARGOS_333 TaxID=1930558 RepID=UPI000B4E0261|nr:hypothetical protein [Micrococcus sp. FDAARGOS_333]PNL17877.1 hypothetical protein CEQ11_007010 [Micrococcus sp. FDAARGOS_333]
MSTARICATPACGRPVVYPVPGLCRPCYLHAPHVGLILPTVGPSGADHGAWKGEAVGYVGAHDRVVRLHGTARLYQCTTCPERASDWSLRPQWATRFDAKAGMWLSPDPEGYTPQCKACNNARRALDQQYQAHAGALYVDTPGGPVPVVAPTLARRLVRWTEAAPTVAETLPLWEDPR